jgi:hypothetical protein
LKPFTTKQQLESFPQGLVILDENERKRHVRLQLCAKSAR